MPSSIMAARFSGAAATANDSAQRLKDWKRESGETVAGAFATTAALPAVAEGAGVVTAEGVEGTGTVAGAAASAKG